MEGEVKEWREKAKMARERTDRYCKWCGKAHSSLNAVLRPFEPVVAEALRNVDATKPDQTVWCKDCRTRKFKAEVDAFQKAHGTDQVRDPPLTPLQRSAPDLGQVRDPPLTRTTLDLVLTEFSLSSRQASWSSRH